MREKKGFTLVELLFVIAIIGVILSLLAPALLTVKRRARCVECISRLHQLSVAIHTYATGHDDTLPYVSSGPEAQPHPKRWYQPSTGVPSVSRFLELLDMPESLAACPADNGCARQSYYPTPPGKTCSEDWGQSWRYNSLCYIEAKGPGYSQSRSGPLYGANPVRLENVPSAYLLAGDFWPHWHFGASSQPGSHYYTNLLFFDGHTEGRHYATQKEGFEYLNWDGLVRWWVPDPPPIPKD
jgi:prepilin-type N-terminal cleavage/methylation domain-containing protein/prepilin-type processing-associated H-X9-DG protein